MQRHQEFLMSVSSTGLSPNPWLRILDALEKKINRHSYDTWLKPTRYSHSTGGVLFVRVPSVANIRRGNVMTNSVNAPSSLSTVIVPPCCCVTMSYAIDSPSPVPSPVGLVRRAVTLRRLLGLFQPSLAPSARRNRAPPPIPCSLFVHIRGV